MNLLFSTLYAPIVLYLFHNYEIKNIAISLSLLSLLWLTFIFKKGIKELIFPLFYLFMSIFAYFIDSFLLLKTLPLFISSLLSLYIFYSYFNNNSFIFIFLEKIKKNVDDKEREYIQNSTLFWGIISLINVSLHLTVLTLENSYWAIYSSFGWYFVFLSAGLIQFIHRKIYFRSN